MGVFNLDPFRSISGPRLRRGAGRLVLGTVLAAACETSAIAAEEAAAPTGGRDGDRATATAEAPATTRPIAVERPEPSPIAALGLRSDGSGATGTAGAAGTTEATPESEPIPLTRAASRQRIDEMSPMSWLARFGDVTVGRPAATAARTTRR